MNSPLQLEQHCLTAVHLESSAEVPNEVINWRVDSTVNVAIHKDNSRKWKVELTIRLLSDNEPKQPYKGSFSFIGFFSVDASYPEEKTPTLVQTNGPSLLYGAIRELCCNLTARGPWPMLLLPTVMFIKGVEKPKTTEESKAAK